MGLKDKLKNRQNSNTPETNALDLCDASIKSIFDNCLGSSETLPGDVERPSLFDNIAYPDFVVTTLTFDFDKQKLQKNYKKIRFMFGQLALVHNNALKLTPDSSLQKYDGSNWNRDDSALMEFYYLAIAARLIFPFSPKTRFASLRDRSIIPTLSPYDPNFPAWWAEHKAEWADPE